MQKEKLQTIFRKLEETRLQLFSQIDSVDEIILKRKPSSEKWNVLQIMFHMISSEQLSLGYMKKKILGGTSVPKSNFKSSVSSYILKVALKYLKWKKPAMLPDPPEELTLTIVKSEWEQVRNQLHDLINNLPEDMINRNIYRHPLAGRMNVLQALEFFQDHFDHHLKQINSLLNKTDLISN